jgi:hypothetical protein
VPRQTSCYDFFYDQGEITAGMNERDYPHVELPLPEGGFRSKSDDIVKFHRDRVGNA